jgi:SAM-dependent methyltransferase
VQDYALPNHWHLARQRLALLEACHDAATFERLDRLGVRAGARCLEAGAGGGSVARWLARRVGPEGRVVAADLDLTLLRRSDEPNLELREMDLTTDPLPEGAFDFVHTRLMLLHVPARDVVLRRLVAALRPGGLLLLEEDDIYPVLATATGAYRAGWEAFLEIMQAGGTDPNWSRDLPERLGALGLTGIDGESTVQLFPGGSSPARLWSLTWHQARERAVALGVPAAPLDAGREALEDGARWFHGPATIAVWGRRPPREAR